MKKYLLKIELEKFKNTVITNLTNIWYNKLSKLYCLQNTYRITQKNKQKEIIKLGFKDPNRLKLGYSCSFLMY